MEQTPYIFKDTLWNNILLFREQYAKKAEELIRQFGLNELDKNLLIENENTLSGGERYRVSLIRALLDEPDILLVDEPSAALDAENAGWIYRYLLQLDVTELIISHDEHAKLLRGIDEILLVKNRKIYQTPR